MRNRLAEARIIDLSDPKKLTESEIEQRKDELYRIEHKLEALHLRQNELICELGEHAPPKSQTRKDVVDSQMFFDQDVDIFDDAPRRERDNPLDELDIEDNEFNSRFATFVSADEEGDHKARRWLGKS